MEECVALILVHAATGFAYDFFCNGKSFAKKIYMLEKHLSSVIEVCGSQHNHFVLDVERQVGSQIVYEVGCFLEAACHFSDVLRIAADR